MDPLIAQGHLCRLFAVCLDDSSMGSMDMDEDGMMSLSQIAFDDFASGFFLVAPLLKMVRSLPDRQVLQEEWRRLVKIPALSRLRESHYLASDEVVFPFDASLACGGAGTAPWILPKQPCDTLGCELMNLGVILVGLSCAQMEGQEDLADQASAAMWSLTHEHLARWLPRVAGDLRRESKLPFFQHLADALLAFWEMFCLYHDVPFMPAIGEHSQEAASP